MLRTRWFSVSGGESGFSILELVVVMGMSSIMMAIAVSSLDSMNNAETASVNQLQGVFKLARSRAVSTTSNYIITPVGPYKVVGKKAITCMDSSAVIDQHVQYNLPAGIQFVNTDWTVCYTSRGVASNTANVAIRNAHGVVKTVEVMLGGGVRVKPN